MKKFSFIFEVDFRAMESEPCALCGKPKSIHFQPGPDADRNLAAHWCPNASGTGFTSMTFRSQKARQHERHS